MDERRKKTTERENVKKNGMTKQEAFKQGKMEKKEKGWNGLRNGVPCLFVAPAMVLLVIFVFYPLVNLIYLSFFDYNLIGRKEFIGLENYRMLFFVKADFLEALQNTAVYTVTVVFFCMLLAVLFAM